MPTAIEKTPLKITNNGNDPLQAVVSVTGAPIVPEPEIEKGFKIERLYHTLSGEAVDISKTVKQNQRFAVVLKITELKPQYGRIIVADYLPAGFEIDNPRLVSSGDTGTLDWIEDAEEPVHSEFRDDRFSRGVPARQRRRGGVHRGLCRARGVAGQICAAAGLCRGHVSSRPLRPHRHRHAGRDGGAMMRRLLKATGAGAVLALAGGALWLYSLGPLPRVDEAGFSTEVVDRDGRLLRPYSAEEGRWRLQSQRRRCRSAFRRDADRV